MYRLKYLQYLSDNPIKYEVGPPLLDDLVTHFNSYYKEQIHLYNTELQNLGRNNNYDFSPLILKNIQNVENIPETKLATITRELHKMVANVDPKSLNHIKNLIFDKKFVDGSMLLTLCCEYSIYVCTRLIRKGELVDKNDLVELYEYGLNSKSILREGNMSIGRFYSMINVLSYVYSFERVNVFIEKWVHIVNAKYPVNTLKIACAMNSFSHEKYGDILVLLRGLKFENRNQRLRAIRLELVALYEEGRYDLLQISINNYMRALKRNREYFSRNLFESNTNLMKVINYLINNDKAAARFILESNNPLVFRDWIRKKLK